MKALIVTLLTTGVLQIANLASGMLSAHFLAPTGRGELAAAQLWPTTLAYLMLLGLSDAALYFSANRRERPQHVFATVFAAGGACAIIAMALGYFVVVPLAYQNYRPEIQH